MIRERVGLKVRRHGTFDGHLVLNTVTARPSRWMSCASLLKGHSRNHSALTVAGNEKMKANAVIHRERENAAVTETDR